MMESRVAGFEVELNEVSSLRIAPWPRPDEFAVKMAGEACATGTVMVLDVIPANSTATCAEVGPSIAYGTTAATWSKRAWIRGAATPLKRTRTPARSVPN